MNLRARQTRFTWVSFLANETNTFDEFCLFVSKCKIRKILKLVKFEVKRGS